MAEKDDNLVNAGNSPLIPIGDVLREDSFSGEGNPYLSQLDSAFEEGTLHIFYKREKKYLESQFAGETALDTKTSQYYRDRLKKLMSAYNHVCQINGIKPYNTEEKKYIPIINEAKEEKQSIAKHPQIEPEPEQESEIPPVIDQQQRGSFFGTLIKIVLPFLLLAVIALAYRELNTIKGYEERLANYSEPAIILTEDNIVPTEDSSQAAEPAADVQKSQGGQPAAAVRENEISVMPARDTEIKNDSQADNDGNNPMPPHPFGHQEMSIMPPPPPPHHHTPLAIRQGLRKALIVEFGNYPQTYKGEKKPIQWIVIHQHPSGEALLLSRYALEAAPFNLDNVPVSWEKSSIRKWLNTKFIDSSFTKDEQNQIIYSSVDNSSIRQYFSHAAAIYWTKKLARDFKDLAGKEWKTADNPSTKDRIFLLSLSEAAKLSPLMLLLKPTEYAMTEQGGRVKTIMPKCDKSGKNCEKTPDTGTTGWWLRSPGIDKNFSAMVFGGRIFAIGTKADYAGNAVRPAMRIKNIYNESFTIIE